MSKHTVCENTIDLANRRLAAVEQALRALWWADGEPSHTEGPDGRIHDLRALLAGSEQR